MDKSTKLRSTLGRQRLVWDALSAEEKLVYVSQQNEINIEAAKLAAIRAAEEAEKARVRAAEEAEKAKIRAAEEAKQAELNRLKELHIAQTKEKLASKKDSTTYTLRASKLQVNRFERTALLPFEFYDIYNILTQIPGPTKGAESVKGEKTKFSVKKRGKSDRHFIEAIVSNTGISVSVESNNPIPYKIIVPNDTFLKGDLSPETPNTADEWIDVYDGEIYIESCRNHFYKAHFDKGPDPLYRFVVKVNIETVFDGANRRLAEQIFYDESYHVGYGSPYYTEDTITGGIMYHCSKRFRCDPYNMGYGIVCDSASVSFNANEKSFDHRYMVYRDGDISIATGGQFSTSDLTRAKAIAQKELSYMTDVQKTITGSENEPSRIVWHGKATSVIQQPVSVTLRDIKLDPITMKELQENRMMVEKRRNECSLCRG